MSLQHLRFQEIDERALVALATEPACETKTLEFKQDLQVATDEQKVEFLSDVTALANSDGGDIVFGMRAEKGVAKELVGLKNFVPDDRIGQFENLLRDCVQPRLPGLQMEARALSNGNYALLIRVGRSWASPHMVRHQGVTRFCGRNSNGKYDLDVQQLRSAFLGSEGISDKLRNFRLDRVNRLASGGTPVQLTSQHLLVLHVLPVVSARPDNL
jgi:predicted HTH transcriptional regulator